MRRYDDPVDVRRGRVPGPGTRVGTRAGAGGEAPVEGPEQFLWKGRLWKVHTVLAQWVETGPWWHSSGVHAVLGADDRADDRVDDWADASGATDGTVRTATRPPFSSSVSLELAAEREVWRVEASRGVATGRGVFDLVFDWTDGSWRLTRCLD